MIGRRAVLIYNPLAGSLRDVRDLLAVVAWWEAQGWSMTVRPTHFPRHAVELAREAAEAGLDLVLAAGGDGTLREVVNGLAGSQTALGLLPAGTGNSLARELNLGRSAVLPPRSLLPDAQLLYGGVVQTVDLLRDQHGNYALQWFGADLTAHIVSRIEPRSKRAKRFGRLGYFVQALAALPGRPRCRSVVEVDGRRLEGSFIIQMISNVRRYVGGEIVLHPDARWDDGLLEVTLLASDHVAAAFWALAQARFGRLAANPAVHRLTGRTAAITTDPPVPYHADGDPLGRTPLVCTVQPAALRLLAPGRPSADAA